MCIYLQAIVSVIVAAFGLLLNAEHINTYTQFRDDGFLPRKSIRQKKTAFLFLFLPKNKPIRWRAYWKYWTTYISLLLYVLILAAGWCAQGSFDFMNNPFLLLYTLWMVLAQVLFELGIDVYVTIKKIQKKRQ